MMTSHQARKAICFNRVSLYCIFRSLHFAVFTRDLLADPLIRGVTDVRHDVVAVASSTSVERAAKFIEKHGIPKSAKAYGTYEELVNGIYHLLTGLGDLVH